MRQIESHYRGNDMSTAIRTIVAILVAGAILLSLGYPSTPQQRVRAVALSSDWVDSWGVVTYSDGAGCSCSRSGSQECSVQYDRNSRNIGACDDEDGTCGDITDCPH